MRRQFSNEEVNRAVKLSRTIAGTSNLLNIPGQFAVVKYWIQLYNIDTAHFTLKKENKKYNTDTRICLQCKQEFTPKLGKYSNPQCCSCKCSNIFYKEKRALSIKDREKEIQCIKCNNKFRVKLNSKNTGICNNCIPTKIYDRVKKSKINNLPRILKITYNNCKWCGQSVEIYRNHKECSRQKRMIKSLSRFGFNNNVIGTLQAPIEFQRIVDLLKSEYYDKMMSLAAICEKYNFTDMGSMGCFLTKQLKFNLRKASESGVNAYLQGRSKVAESSSIQFNNGYHQTWDNKQIHYRSSYELDYYKKLDEQKIRYLGENLRLKYFDTIKQKYRTAIPDIYLPDTNTIIEVKSAYTYSKQNMIDRYIAYKAAGYNIKLILDKKEYTDILPEQKNTKLLSDRFE